MAIAFDGYTLIPELQHWFNHFIVEESIVNKYENPPPVDIPEEFLPDNSFIAMLFNDNYAETDYEWRYVEVTDYYCIPPMASRRLQIYPGSWKYLTTDSDGENIFNLQPIDFTMLDVLLAYRIDETSVTMIDTTSGVNFISDTTANVYILDASYSGMTTDLSKLIYLYLDLEINGNYQNYNNTGIISDCQVLESLYEAYLIDRYYKFMSGRQPDLEIVCPPDEPTVTPI
ncbi:MAG: hypothetical protein ACTSX1_07960 [Candidatus Heimdallarchaeaceae archaeon]